MATGEMNGFSLDSPPLLATVKIATLNPYTSNS